MSNTILSEYRDLHEAIYNCKLCEKYGYYAEKVQPKWDPSKMHRTTIHRWGMLIGQAPGRSELREQKAFQGRAGGKLGKWLLQAGFSEEQILGQITPQLLRTSVTKCYPGKHRRNDRKPTGKETELCAPFLRQQIRLIRPRVLIPMGMAAINWFFPETRRLEEVVGRKRFWSQGPSDSAVICLPHPSPGSRWLNTGTNQELLGTALRLLHQLWVTTFDQNDVSNPRR